MTAKITNFNCDPEFYYNLAVKNLDDGNYLRSLELLWQGLRFAQNDDEAQNEIYLLAAEAYSAMEYYNLSNKYLFLLLAKDYELEEVFYMLIKNCLYTENPELAFYYVKLGVEMGALDPEMALATLEDTLQDAQNDFVLLKPEDSEKTLELAKQLMNSGGTSYAKQMLEGIPKASPQHSESRVCLALINYSEGEFEECIKNCDTALAVDAFDEGAITAKLLAVHALGSKDEDELIKNLDSLELSSFSQLSKAALCFCEINNSQKAKQYSDKVLDIAPFDREMLLLNALARVNTGDKNGAKNNIVKLLSIFPNDYIVKSIASQIDLLKTNQTLPLSIDLCIDDKKAIVAKIENEYLLCGSAKDFVKKLTCDDSLYECVLWAAGSPNLTLAVKIVQMLLEGGDTQIISNLLLDPDISPVVKKYCFLYLLSERGQRAIRLVYNGEYRFFKVRAPKCTNNKILINVYWRVFATLVFIEPESDKSLFAIFKKIAPLMEDFAVDDSDENAFAALLAYKSKAAKLFEKSIYCCELFGCSEEAFVELEKKLDEALAFKKQAPKKKETKND